MGLRTRATIEEALEDAKKKYVGESPSILALPQTFKLSAVHLMLENETYGREEDYMHMVHHHM